MNTGEWGTPSEDIKEPMEDLKGDYKLAEKYILPSEQEKVIGLRELYEYSNTQYMFEYIKFHQRDQDHFSSNFVEFSTKMEKLNNGVSLDLIARWAYFGEFI